MSGSASTQASGSWFISSLPYLHLLPGRPLVLQGLDVVHEVTEDEDEEEDATTQEGRWFPSIEVEKRVQANLRDGTH